MKDNKRFRKTTGDKKDTITQFKILNWILNWREKNKTKQKTYHKVCEWDNWENLNIDCRPGNIMLIDVTFSDSDNYTLAGGKMLLSSGKSHGSGGKRGTASDTLKWLTKVRVVCMCRARKAMIKQMWQT